jgi:hypothetical protein
MRFKITTQNSLPPIKIERERKLAEWKAHCETLESTLGVCSPENSSQYAASLKELDDAQERDYSLFVFRKFPKSKDALKEILNEMGADVIVLEITPEGVIGVVYV